MPGVQENFRNLHHHIFSAGIGIAGLYFTVRLSMDIFNIIMHCLVFHVVSGAAAAYYAYRRCKVVGAAYSYGILSASVLWSVIGTLLFRRLPITFLIGILLAGMRQNNHLSLVLSNINGIFLLLCLF